MEIKEGRGKLYLIVGGSEQFVSDIDHKLYQEVDVEVERWWGECYIDRGVKISEEEGYVVELSDGCRGHCFVKKLVNRVLPGIPARNVYRINGVGPLK
jgi:hypothetical protein